jgi:hypothetical protein
MITRLAALLFIAFFSSAAIAQEVRPNEPGPGQLNGTNDCVLVSGGTTKGNLCPKHAYMKVCGAPNGQSDRKRTCVKG